MKLIGELKMFKSLSMWIKCICCIWSVHAVLGLAKKNDVKACMLPIYGEDGHDDGHPSSQCVLDNDCCGSASCVSNKCTMPDGSATQSAYAAHLILLQTQNEMSLVSKYLESVTQDIAAASEQLKAAGLNAAKKLEGFKESSGELLDKAKTKLKENAASSSLDIKKSFDAASKDIEAEVEKIKDSTNKYEDNVAKGLDEAQSSSEKSLDAIKKNIKETVNQAASKVDSPLKSNVEVKTAQSDNDHHPRAHPAHVVSIGSGSDNAQVSNIGNEDAEKDENEIRNNDYRSFISRLSSEDSKQRMNFSWELLYSGSAVLQSEPNMVELVNKADDTNDAVKRHLNESCGDTAYKAFGKCSEGLICWRVPLLSIFVAGKCVSKKDNDSALTNRTKHRRIDIVDIKDYGAYESGEEGDPCDYWKLGHVDFGRCKDGLECAANDEATIMHKKNVYSFPNVCKNFTALALHESEPEEGMTDETELSEQLRTAKMVADSANKAALASADAAEVLAQRLLAAVAQVRDAAAKLQAETNVKASDVLENNSAMAATEAPEQAGSTGFVVVSMLILGLLICLIWTWKSQSTSGYIRV